MLENVRNLKKPEIGENVRVGPTNQTDLFRARFVPSVEVEDGRRFAESLVKQITGGDRIRARRMREDLWEFDPTHTVIVAANHKPEVRGTDVGIWRRIKVVPWTVRIPEAERNPHLPRELESELEGILAWCVRGAVEWYREGLTDPEEVRAQTVEYKKDMDVLASFIFERCVEGPKVTAVSSQLFKAWEMWCDENNEKAGTQTRFSTRMKERGYHKDQAKSGPDKGKMIWYGIGVKSDDDDPPPESRVEPSTVSEPSTDPLPAESVIDKPNPENVQDESRGLNEKSGSTPSFLRENSGLTEKPSSTLYSLPNSLPDFARAVDELKGDA